MLGTVLICDICFSIIAISKGFSDASQKRAFDDMKRAGGVWHNSKAFCASCAKEEVWEPKFISDSSLNSCLKMKDYGSSNGASLQKNKQ